MLPSAKKELKRITTFPIHSSHFRREWHFEGKKIIFILATEITKNI